MYNWNQFRNLPKYKDLPVNEQARQFFLYETSDASAASSSSAGAGGAGGGSPRSSYSQTVLVTFTLEGQENWKYIIMDVETGKVKGQFDTGINSSIENWNSTIVQNKGYTLVFNNSGTFTTLFINPLGQIIGTFDCNSYQDWLLGGFSSLFLNYDNNDVYFFDGVNVAKYEFPDVFDGISLMSNWDDMMMDGSCVLRIVYVDYTSYRLINLNTNVEIYNSTDPTVYIYSYSYASGDFTIILTRDDNTGQYLELKIFDNKGLVLEDVDLSSLNLYAQTRNFYSYNQFQLLFTGSTNLEDYVMYNYNGDTKNLVIHNIPRGDYFKHDVEYNSVLPYDDYSFTPGSIVTYFYGEGYNYYGPFDSSSTTFAKAVYMFDGDNSYTDYTICNSPIVSVYQITGTPAVIGTFSSVSANISIAYSVPANPGKTSSGTASLFTVVSDGSNYTVTIIDGGYGYYIGDQLTISGDLLGGSASINDVTFYINTKEVNFSFWPQTSDKSIITDVDTGDGMVSNLVFLPGGSQSIIPLQSKTNLDYYDNESFGDKKFYAFYINDGVQSTKYKIVNYDGTLLTTGPTMSYYVSNYRYQKDTLYIRSWSGGGCWYYNNTSNGIEPLDTFYSQRQYVYNSEFEKSLDDGTIVLFNPFYYTGPSFRILKPNSITSDISVFSSTYWDYALGTQNLMYYYRDESGKVVIELYDFTGTLVKRVQTEYTSVSNWVVSDERFFFILDNTITYLITPTKTAISNIGDNHNLSLNDYRWWNN